MTDSPHQPECPSCGFLVWDYEPGKSSAVYNKELFHPDCARQEWMIAVNDLLLKAGITENVTKAAGEAYEQEDTPQEFVNALLRGPA